MVDSGRVWEEPKLNHVVTSAELDQQEEERLVERWDVEHPNGEGDLLFQRHVLDERGRKKMERTMCSFTWVEITDSGKRLCNMVLIHDSQEVREMYIDQPRKGKKPNPYFRVGLASLAWENQPAIVVSDLRSQIETADVRARTNDEGSDAMVDPFDVKLGRSGIRATHTYEGVSPVSGARVEPARDDDHRFILGNGESACSIRGSKLAPVLLEMSNHGLTSVELSTVRKAVARYN